MYDYDSIDKGKVIEELKGELLKCEFTKKKLNEYIVRKSPYIATSLSYTYDSFDNEKAILLSKEPPENFFIRRIQLVLYFLLGIIPFFIYLFFHRKKQKSFKNRIASILKDNFPITDEYEVLEGTKYVISDSS